MLDRRLFLCGALAACTTTPSLSAGIPTIAASGGGVPSIEYLRQTGRAAGGRKGIALLAPYASRNHAQALEIAKWQFDVAGLRPPTLLPLDSSAIELVQQASYISFSGGIQNRQMQALRRVPGLIPALQEAYQRGCVMEGGSAGAAVLSRLMISGGSRGTAHTRTGLGFLQNIVLDQHVIARSREWRLRQVIGNNRSKLGVGIDESTGILLRGNTFRVYGKSKVIVSQWMNGGIQETVLKRGQTFQVPARYL